MASKREMGLLLAKSVKAANAKKQESPAGGSKVALKVKPISSVPATGSNKRPKLSGPEVVVVGERPMVDLVVTAVDKGSEGTNGSEVTKGSEMAKGSEGAKGSEAAGSSYASPTFSGTTLPLPVPAELDARLLDERKSRYLNQFPPATLFKQLKGMAVYSATVLKHFESGSAWEDAMKAEKLRLRAAADNKVALVAASFEKEKALLIKEKEDAVAKAVEASRLQKEEATKVTALSDQLAAAKEEARVAKEQLAKATEDLTAKTDALKEAELNLVAMTETKDQFEKAVFGTWENAQEQIQLISPGVDLSWMAMDGWVEEGALFRFNEVGEIVKVNLPGSGTP